MIFPYLKKIILLFNLYLISKINFKLIITIVSLSFIGLSIYNNLDEFSSQKIDKSAFLWICSAFIFSLISIVINGFAWKLLIKSLGFDNNKLNIINIFLNTNIYKYMPGGVWHFVYRFNILRREMSIEKSVESILLEPLLMLVAGIIFIPFGINNLYIFIFCWSCPLVFLTNFREFIVNNLKKIKSSIFTEVKTKNPINFNNLEYSKKTFFPYKALLIESLFIFVRFLGFYSCLNAFSIGLLIPQGLLISGFSLAWIVGLIVPAAPGGLGVFETVILFSFGSDLPEAPLLASLLFYRLVSTIADICAALIYPFSKFFFKFTKV